MISYPASMMKLVRELAKLPSIGERSATRLAYHIVNNDRALAETLAASLRDAAQKIKLCARCFFLSETELCEICASSARDGSVLCVVEKPADVLAIERSGEFKGYYHVLHGVWAPLRGIGAEHMRVQELVERLKEGAVREVILATGSTVEGDATALYLSRLISDLGVRPSRLAQGLPKGGELEYTDELTLARAFQGRR